MKIMDWWRKVQGYVPPEENEFGYKTLTVELTFKRNIWMGKDRPLRDTVSITAAGWCHPHTIDHDRLEPFWTDLLDRIEGKVLVRS